MQKPLNAEGNVVQLPAVQNHPVRRGRGRPSGPRARGLPALEAADNVQVQDNQGVHRGRRRGSPPTAYVVNSNSAFSEEDHDHPEFDAFLAAQNRIFLQRRANIMCFSHKIVVSPLSVVPCDCTYQKHIILYLRKPKRLANPPF